MHVHLQFEFYVDYSMTCSFYLNDKWPFFQTKRILQKILSTLMLSSYIQLPITVLRASSSARTRTVRTPSVCVTSTTTVEITRTRRTVRTDNVSTSSSSVATTSVSPRAGCVMGTMTAGTIVRNTPPSVVRKPFFFSVEIKKI